MQRVSTARTLSLSRGFKPFVIFALLLLTAVRALAGQSNLAWDAAADSAVSGYMVYYGTSNGNYTAKIDAGKVTNYTVPNLTEGQTYYFAVTSYDSAKNESGYSNQTSATIASAAALSASFGASVTSGPAPLTTTFQASTSAPVASYSWNFGDGTTGTGPAPAKTYSTAGTYTVSLTVTTSTGVKATTSRANYISVGTATAITADFSASATSGVAPLAVSFTSKTTGTISSYAWNFGDGTSSTAANPAKTYSSPGIYTVSLTVTGASGSKTTSKASYITVTAPTTTALAANFTASKTSGPAPLAVSFTDGSTGSIASYLWNFGDGTTSTAKSPSKTFSNPGAYTVTLKVTATNGATSSKSVKVTVSRPGLVAAYSFDEGTGTRLNDTSGMGNAGTISGAAWAAGRYGKALSFNGYNSWVTVADSASLDLTTGMTLEAWIYPNGAMSGWRDVMMKEQPGNAVYYLAANTDRSVPASGLVVGGSERILFGASQPAASAWTHLAATWDGATQRIYVNGVLVRSQSVSGTLPNSSSPLRIGGDSIWGEYFKGLIDEIRIYRRALSQAEIQGDMGVPVATRP